MIVKEKGQSCIGNRNRRRDLGKANTYLGVALEHHDAKVLFVFFGGVFFVIAHYSAFVPHPLVRIGNAGVLPARHEPDWEDVVRRTGSSYGSCRADRTDGTHNNRPDRERRGTWRRHEIDGRRRCDCNGEVSVLYGQAVC